MKVEVFLLLTVITVTFAQTSCPAKGTSGSDQSLQAENFCDCMTRHYENDRYEACKVTDGLDVSLLLKDIESLTLECTSLPIPGADQLMTSDFLSSLPLMKSDIMARDRCECIYRKVIGGKIPSCHGKKATDLVQITREVLTAAQCEE